MDEENSLTSTRAKNEEQASETAKTEGNFVLQSEPLPVEEEVDRKSATVSNSLEAIDVTENATKSSGELSLMPWWISLLVFLDLAVLCSYILYFYR